MALGAGGQPLGRFNADVGGQLAERRSDRTGGINRIFKYVNAVRDAGQRLKARNRRGYYLLKWLVIAAIFAAIIIPSL